MHYSDLSKLTAISTLPNYTVGFAYMPLRALALLLNWLWLRFFVMKNFVNKVADDFITHDNVYQSLVGAFKLRLSECQTHFYTIIEIPEEIRADCETSVLIAFTESQTHDLLNGIKVNGMSYILDTAHFICTLNLQNYNGMFILEHPKFVYLCALRQHIKLILLWSIVQITLIMTLAYIVLKIV